MGTQWFTSPVRMKSVFLLAAIVCVAIASEEVVRKPRLFYVSTSSSTSVISTASICYVATTTAVTACKRKKRMVALDLETKSLVQPSMMETLQSDEKVEIETSPSMEREGRILVYWITTTSVSYSTSYTTTWSVSSITCLVPGGNICG